MIADNMREAVENNSVIRVMFEEGKEMKKIYGEDNVFDFSLGNPCLPPPKYIDEAIIDTLKEDSMLVHGYMSNAGFEDTRDAIAKSLNKKFGVTFTFENIIMTAGAAFGLNIVFKSILNPDDEVIVFAPYFMEYNNYIKNYNGKVVVISPDTTTFEPKLEELESKINNKTKAVLINTPNNPTGVVYSEDIIRKISDILNKKQKELNTDIYLISDEPYRELVYDDIKVPYITKYYNNSFVVYSYSKSLSLPGERIGYVVIPNEMKNYKDMITAVTISNRIIGCVNAPSLMQRVIMKCVDKDLELSSYDIKRKMLYDALISCGFECIKPQGAFYLFLRSPIPDDKEFCKEAKKYNILFVPGSSFGCPGFVRIAYCVSEKTIKKSIPQFEKLAKKYFNK